jgi:phosphatidylglycerol---prolipoprotein diacylglyceryl transferase
MRPILFKIPFLGTPFYAYGVLLGLAFISGWYLAYYFTNKEGLPYKAVTWAFFLVVLSSLVGARLAHILSNDPWGRIQSQGILKVVFTFQGEGLVAYGGFIGGTLAIVLYTWLRKISMWSLLDCATPGLALGLGITRIGCFLGGCCHGRPTNSIFGVVFPQGSHAARIFPDPTAPLEHAYSLPMHPTQLYESVLGLFLLLPVSVWLMKRRRFTGQSFLAFMALYAMGRFFLEFLRGDNDRGASFDLFSPSQFIGLCVLPLALGLYIYRHRFGSPAPAPLTKQEVERSLMQQGIKGRRR